MVIDSALSLYDLPSTIYTKTTEGKGRECLASQSIEPSTTLLSVYPYSTAIFDSYKKRLCARCLAAHPTKSFTTHCLGCDQVYFCSTICADLYLSDHDQWCCDILRRLASLKKVDRHMKSVAKLVIMVYWQRHVRGKTDHRDNGGDMNKMTCSYDLVHHLESHYDDWSPEMKQEWNRIQCFLWKFLSPMDWLFPHETDVDIMHLVSKIESNGFGIYLENRLDVVVGRALYPLASLFNHDCTYNCEVEQWTEEGIEDELVTMDLSDDQQQQSEPVDCSLSNENVNNKEQQEIRKVYPSVFTQPRGKFRQMFIRTIATVLPHECLTIGYVDTSLPVANRRQKLLQDYYFTCECQRCVVESKIGGGPSSGSNKKNKKKKNKGKINGSVC
ncbi:hypothetical protein BCR42DRAFT_488846 [Absidia repens]|uniref:SET domain-containing protein n=1 Tax=Absidia repens TaxID=90262 RepID=A0A1X2IPW1_9FUNG|nr:hypothetical protein BCR42DRAFT_488846 [Absidia repens]